MTTFAQRSFAGGEIAPSLYSRVDTTKYQSGLRTCRNFSVMRHGGVQNRPGTKFLAEVKDSSKAVRLIPFVFNATQTYVLEFGNLYMRVYRAGAQVSVSGVTAWSAVTAYVVGDLASRLGVNYYCIAAHTNQQPPNATYWYPLTGSIYEIPTPYLEADLDELQYVQSADVITLVHPTYAPRELARSGHTTWTLTAISFTPAQEAPTGASVTTPAAGTGNNYGYKVTAVSATTGEESLPTADFSTSNTGAVTTTAGNELGWTAAAGAGSYNIYSRTPNLAGGVYAFIGSSDTTTFAHVAQTPDFTKTPPVANNPFGSSNNYPSAVGYYQQRRLFGGTNNDPEKIWASRTGLHTNYTATSPVQDDNYVAFSLVGRFVNQIRSLLDLGRLVIFTSGGEWTANGDGSGALTPTAINARQASYNGSSTLPPLVIGNNALYCQARGSIVRDLAFDFAVDGYKGNDLTLFAAHLFDDNSLVDWTYAQTPHSIVWAVRDDGTLLGLTYIPEHQIWAWHRHDTDGLFENVCAVPEGTEDAVYCVVNRTIDGSAVRYVERFATRRVDDIVDSIFMDSAATYDGRNTGSTTMTLSGGSTWAAGETLTLTASVATFAGASTDVGNAVHITGSDGTLYRASIILQNSTTVCSVQVDKNLPVALQGVATTNWALAVDSVSGLDHLEGEQVSVLGDGFVVANPNNPAEDTYTVTSGAVSFDEPYAVIQVGLPYLSDLETLDIDTVQGETLVDKKKLVNKVTVNLEASRGLWAGAKEPEGDDAVGGDSGLRELKQREAEGYDEPVALATRAEEIIIKSEWNSNGRVFLRQADPLPMTILSVNPSGVIPTRN